MRNVVSAGVRSAPTTFRSAAPSRRPIDPTRRRDCAKLVDRLLRNSETTVGFQFYVDRFQSCLSLLISARLDWKIRRQRYTK